MPYRIVIADTDDDTEHAYECSAFTLGMCVDEETKTTQLAFMAGPGAFLVRSLDAIMKGAAREPRLVGAYLGARVSGELNDQAVTISREHKSLRDMLDSEPDDEDEEDEGDDEEGGPDGKW